MMLIPQVHGHVLEVRIGFCVEGDSLHPVSKFDIGEVVRGQPVARFNIVGVEDGQFAAAFRRAEDVFNDGVMLKKGVFFSGFESATDIASRNSAEI